MRALVLGVAAIAACGARQAPGGGGDSQVERSFPAAGIKRVELRASAATAAQVTEVTEVAGGDVRVSGTAQGGAKSDASEPGFREIPAARWGLDFASRRYGELLVISTSKEVSDIQHRYTVEDLVIAVPEGVEVELVSRALTASGTPDLAPSEGE
jgi:hypothetical protein